MVLFALFGEFIKTGLVFYALRPFRSGILIQGFQDGGMEIHNEIMFKMQEASGGGFFVRCHASGFGA